MLRIFLHPGFKGRVGWNDNEYSCIASFFTAFYSGVTVIAGYIIDTVSDMFPKKSVGSVIGIGDMAGGIGGVLIQRLSGILNTHYQSHPQTAYLIMFTISALAYITAWSVIRLLTRKPSVIEV